MLKNLRKIRERQGLSRWKLAQLSGVSPETIEQAENGTNSRIDTCQKLAKALGVSVEQLLGGRR